MKRVFSNRRARAAVVVAAVLLLALVPVLVWGQTPPTAPTALFMHSTDAQSGDASPATDVDLTPVFSAIFNDADLGAIGKKIKIQVSTDQTFATVSHWNSSQISIADVESGSRCANVDYNGTALSGLTTYYWRCRFWDEADGAGAWSTVATFTTGPAPLAPLGLFVDSLDASAGTSGNPVEEIDQTPVFTAVFTHQSNSSPAQKAKIQVSTDPTFATITNWNSGQLTISNTSNGSRTPNITYGGQILSGDTTFYWRIRLTDALGNIGPWSTEAASFHTNVVPSQPSVLQVGSTEAQTGSSGNPVAGIDLTPIFSALFNHPTGGITSTKVKIQVTTDSSFHSITHWNSGKITIPSVTAGSRCADVAYNGQALAGLQTYYWRARFFDTNGGVGEWSTEAASFSTAGAMLAPDILFVGNTEAQSGSPGNPVNLVDLNPAFSAIYRHQSAGVPANKAKVQVTTDPTFANITNWNSGQLDIADVATGQRCADIAYNGQLLHGNTRYYWRVRFYDVNGVAGPWSTEAASFITILAPIEPTVLYVGSTEAQTGASGNPVVDVDLSPVFSAVFNHQDEAGIGKKIKIQVSTDSTFSTITHWNSGNINVADVLNAARCRDVPYAGSPLESGTTYYWRCRFLDAYPSTGPWSVEAASFTTASDVNHPPVIDATGDFLVYEGGTLDFPITVHDQDVGDIVTVTVAQEGSPSLPAGASLTPSNRFQWVPDFQQAGSYTFIITAIDNDPAPETSSAIFHVTVVNVNRAPTLSVLPIVNVDEGQSVTIQIGIADPDLADTHTLEIAMASGAALPAGVSLDATLRQIVWQTRYDQAGSYELVVTARDNGNPALSGNAPVTVVVANVPHFVEVVQHSPTDGQIGVSRSAQIIVEFSEAVALPAADSFMVRSSLGGRIPGVFSATGPSITFTPAYALPAGESLIVTLTTAIVSPLGAPLSGNVSWQFRVAATVSPAGFSRDEVLVNTTLESGATILPLDFDLDGAVDFLAIARSAGLPNKLYRNIGGQFAPVATVGVGLEGPSGAVVMDFDNDGRPDLVQWYANSAFLYRNEGASFALFGSFVHGISLPSDAIAGDLTGDGLPEFAISSTTGNVAVFGALLGDFTLLGSVDLPNAASTTCVLGYTGPRQQGPRLIAGFGPAVHVVTTFANATLTIESSHPVPGDYVRHIEVADTNFDGLPDIAALATDLLILPGNAGGFGAASVIAWPAAGATSFELRDLDGDNQIDLVCVYPTEALIGLGLGNANAFTRHETVSTGLGSESILLQTVIVDFNGDGRVDVLASRNNGNLQVFLNGQRIGVSVQSATTTAPTSGTAEILIPVVLDHVPVNQVLLQFETFEEPPPGGGGESDAVGDIGDMMSGQTSGSGWYTATSGLLVFGRGITTQYIRVPISATFAQPSVLSFSIRLTVVVPFPITHPTSSTVLLASTAQATVVHGGGSSGPPASTANARDWKVLGQVNSVASSGGVTYFGGSFAGIGWDRASLASRSVATGLPGGLDWSKIDNGQGVFGGQRKIWAVEVDGFGNVYIGGEFSYTPPGGSPLFNIVKVTSAGSVDTAFNPNPSISGNNGVVYAIVSLGNRVYFGGYFNRHAFLSVPSNDDAGSLACLQPNGSGGYQRVVTGLIAIGSSGTTPGNVLALKINAAGSTLLVGGEFNHATSASPISWTAAQNFAAFSLSTGGKFTTPSFSGTGVSRINAIAVNGVDVLLGGVFNQVDSVGYALAPNLFNVSDGGSSFTYNLAATPKPAPPSTTSLQEVFSLAFYLPASGTHRLVVGQAGSRITPTAPALVFFDWNGTWGSTAIDTFHARAKSVAVFGDVVYVASNDSPGASWFQRNQSAFNLIPAQFGFPVAPGGSANGPINAMLVTASGIAMFGGDFTEMSVERGSIAAFSENTDALLDWRPRPNGAVNTAIVVGTRVIFGGDFTMVNSNASFAGIAAAPTFGTGTPDQVLTWLGLAPRTNGPVNVIRHDASLGVFYVGGSFTQFNNEARSGIAVINATTGGVRVEWDIAITNGSNAAVVYDVQISGTQAYIAGAFTQVGGIARLGAASVSAYQTPMPSMTVGAWAPALSNGASAPEVRTLALDAHGGVIFIGGSFSAVGADARQNLACVHISSGAATTWTCDANSAVRALALTGGGSLYVAGEFTAIGTTGLRGVALVDNQTGLVSTSWQPQPVFQSGGGVFCATIAVPAIGGLRITIGGKFSSITGSRPDIAWYSLPVEITPPSLLVAEEGVQYSDQLGLTISVAATWTFGLGLPTELQPWLQLNALTGNLHGLPPTGIVPVSMTERLFNVPVVANVSGGSVQRNFILRVVGAPRVFIEAQVQTPTPPHMEFMETDQPAQWISGAIVVRLSRPAPQPIDVEVGFVNGTAVSGRDYVLSEVVAKFATGHDTALLPLCIFGDDFVQPSPRTFGLYILAVRTGTAVAQSASSVPVWILEDDVPGPRYSVAANVRVMNDPQWPATQDHVVSNAPFIAWDFFSDDPMRNQSQYLASVYSDAALQVLIWQDSGTTAQGVTCGVSLLDGHSYWVKVTLTDDQSHQGTPVVLPFRLNTPPPAVNPNTQTSGTITDSTPTLSFDIGVDGDSDPLHFAVKLTQVSTGNVTLIESINYWSAFEYSIASSGYLPLPPQGLSATQVAQVRFTVPAVAALQNGDYTWAVEVADSFEVTAASTSVPTITMQASYRVRGQVFEVLGVSDAAERDVHLVRTKTGAVLGTYRIGGTAPGTLPNGQFEFQVNEALAEGEALALYLGNAYSGAAAANGATVRQFGGGDMIASAGPNQAVQIVHDVLSVDQRVGANLTGEAFKNPSPTPYDQKIGWSNPSPAEIEISVWVQTLQISGSLALMNPASGEPGILLFPSFALGSQITSVAAGSSILVSSGAVFDADQLQLAGLATIEAGGRLIVRETSQCSGRFALGAGSHFNLEDAILTISDGSILAHGVNFTNNGASSCLDCSGTTHIDVSDSQFVAIRFVLRKDVQLTRLERLSFNGAANSLPGTTGLPSHLRWERESSAGGYVARYLVFSQLLVTGVTANISASSTSDVINAFAATGIGSGESFDDDPLDGSADRIRFDIAKVSGLTAEAGNTRVRLQWSDEGQTGGGSVFWVYSDSSPTFTTAQRVAELSGTQYIDSGLQNGQPRYYYVTVGPSSGTPAQEVVAARSDSTTATPGAAAVNLVSPTEVGITGRTSITVSAENTHWTGAIQVESSATQITPDLQSVFLPSQSSLFFDVTAQGVAPATPFTITLRQSNIWGVTGYDEVFVLNLSTVEAYSASPPVVSFESTQGGVVDHARTSGAFALYVKFDQNYGAPLDFNTFEFFASDDVAVSGLTVGQPAQQPGVLLPSENLALPAYQLFAVQGDHAFAWAEQLNSSQMGQTLPAGYETYSKGRYELRARICNIYGVWSAWATITLFVEGAQPDIAILDGAFEQGVTKQIEFYGTGLTNVTAVEFPIGAGVSVNSQSIAFVRTQPVPGGGLDYVWHATFAVEDTAPTGLMVGEVKDGANKIADLDPPVLRANWRMMAPKTTVQLGPVSDGVGVDMVDLEFNRVESDTSTRSRVFPISFQRNYGSREVVTLTGGTASKGPFGSGWWSNYHQMLFVQSVDSAGQPTQFYWFGPDSRMTYMSWYQDSRSFRPAHGWGKATAYFESTNIGAPVSEYRNQILLRDASGLSYRFQLAVDNGPNPLHGASNAIYRLTSVTDGSGNQHKLEYDIIGDAAREHEWRLARILDDVASSGDLEHGEVLTLEYDDKGRIAKVVHRRTTPVIGAVGGEIRHLEYEYDIDSSLTLVRLPDAAGHQGDYMGYGYERNGVTFHSFLTHVYSPLSCRRASFGTIDTASSNYVLKNVYDFGHNASYVPPNPEGTDDDPKVTHQFIRNSLGAGGVAGPLVTFTYTLESSPPQTTVRDPEGHITKYRFAGMIGELPTEIERVPNGKSTGPIRKMTHDNRGRTLSESWPRTIGSIQRSVEYIYDVGNQQTRDGSNTDISNGVGVAFVGNYVSAPSTTLVTFTLDVATWTGSAMPSFIRLRGGTPVIQRYYSIASVQAPNALRVNGNLVTDGWPGYLPQTVIADFFFGGSPEFASWNPTQIVERPAGEHTIVDQRITHNSFAAFDVAQGFQIQLTDSKSPSGVSTFSVRTLVGVNSAKPPTSAGDRTLIVVTRLSGARIFAPDMGEQTAASITFDSSSISDAFGRPTAASSLDNSTTSFGNRYRNEQFIYADSTSGVLGLQRWKLKTRKIQFRNHGKLSGNTAVVEDSPTYPTVEFNYGYSALTGQLEWELDPRGQADLGLTLGRTEYTFDERDQLRMTIYPALDLNLGRPVAVNYFDAAGNLATSLTKHQPGEALHGSQSPSNPDLSLTSDAAWSNQRTALNSSVNGPNSRGWVHHHWEYDFFGRVTKHRWEELLSKYGITTGTPGSPSGNPDEYALTELVESRTYTPNGNLKTATDAMGHALVMEYNEYGSLLKTSRPASDESAPSTTIESRVYDSNQNLLAVSDTDSNSQFFGYDGFDRPVLSIGLKGQNNLRLATLTDYPFPRSQPQETSQYAFETAADISLDPTKIQGELQQQIDALEELDKTSALKATKSFADGFGRAYLSAWMALDHKRAGLLSAVDSRNSHWATSGVEFDVHTQEAKYSVDATGREIATWSDALGRPCRESLDSDNPFAPLKSVRNHAWDKFNKVHVVTEIGLDTALYNTTSYTATTTTSMDTAGRPVKIVDPDGLETNLRYGLTGGVWESVLPSGRTVRVEYDWSGRVLTEYERDGTANKTEQRKVYDKNGNMVAEATKVSGGWNITRHVYDALDRLTKTIGPDQQTTMYTYDTLDRIKTTTFPNGVTITYTYSTASELTNSTVGGTAVSGNQSIDYTYDTLGRKTRCVSTDASGAKVDLAWEYNTLDLPETQKTLVTLPGASTVLGVQFGALDATEPSGIAAPSKTGFDSLYASQGSGVGTESVWEITLDYDAAGNRIHEEFWDDRWLQHIYLDGKLWKTNEVTGGTNLGKIADYKYVGWDRLESVALGHNGSRGGVAKAQKHHTRRFGMTNAARVTDILVSRSAPFRTFSKYQRLFELGRVKAVRNLQDGNSGTMIEFDSQQRMTDCWHGLHLTDNQIQGAASLPNPITQPSSWAREVIYSYDDLGNRSSAIEATRAGIVREHRTYTMDSQGTSTPQTSTQKYDAADSDLHPSVLGLGYDNQSRLTDDPSTELNFKYDAEGRMTGVNNGGPIQQIVYDCMGRKTLEVSGTVDENKIYRLTIYDPAGPGGTLGANAMAEITFVKESSGYIANDLVQFTNGLGLTGNGVGAKRICEFLAYIRSVEDKGPSYRFLNEDPMGSTITTVNQFADRVDEFSYTDFGTPIWRPVAFDAARDKIGSVAPVGPATSDKTVITLLQSTLVPGSLCGLEISVINPDAPDSANHVRTSIVSGNTQNTITVYDLQNDDPQNRVVGEFRAAFNASVNSGIVVYDLNHGYLQGRIENVPFTETRSSIGTVTCIRDPSGILVSTWLVSGFLYVAGAPPLPVFALEDVLDASGSPGVGDGILDQVVLYGDVRSALAQFQWFMFRSQNPRLTQSGFIESVTANSGPPSTTRIDVDEWTHLSVGQIGWLCQPNSREPVYYEVTNVDPFGHWFEVAGDATAILKGYQAGSPPTLIRDANRFRLFAPPGVDRREDIEGAISPWPGVQTTHYLFATGIFETPLTSFKEVNSTSAPAPGITGWNLHGQYYLWNRRYDPWLGRFTTPDPARSPGYNLFEYGGNDPFHMYDPEGLYPVFPAWMSETAEAADRIWTGIGAIGAFPVEFYRQTQGSIVEPHLTRGGRQLGENYEKRVELLEAGGNNGFVAHTSATLLLLGDVTGATAVAEAYSGIDSVEGKYLTDHERRVRGLVGVVQLGLTAYGGAKSLAEARSVARIIRPIQQSARAVESPFVRRAGTLTLKEELEIAKIAQKFQIEIDIVGSRAKGLGRNIETDLPVGKGRPRSDIDFRFDTSHPQAQMIINELKKVGNGAGSAGMKNRWNTSSFPTYPPFIRISPFKHSKWK